MTDWRGDGRGEGTAGNGAIRLPSSGSSFHEPDPLIPSFSPNGGEGARRAVEGDSGRFMVPMRGRRAEGALREERAERRAKTPFLSPALSSRFAGGEPFAGHLVKATRKELGQGCIGTHGQEPFAEVRQELPFQRLALLGRNGRFVVFRARMARQQAAEIQVTRRVRRIQQ